VEFLMEDAQRQILDQQSGTMGRWILWRPVIPQVYDNWLLPLASREYTVDYRIPEPSAGLTLKTRARYHILTEGQHGILKEQYGLTGNELFALTLYERDLPLSAGLTALLREQETGRLI
jgi:hypothetical protein